METNNYSLRILTQNYTIVLDKKEYLKFYNFQQIICIRNS